MVTGMVRKPRARPVLLNAISLNADEYQVLKKYWQMRWPGEELDEEVTADEWREIYFENCRDTEALKLALSMLPVVSGTKAELVAMGDINSAGKYLTEPRPDPRWKEVLATLQKIEAQLRSPGAEIIHRFQSYDIQIASQLGEFSRHA